MEEAAIITTYEMPDMDGYACVVAYAEYLTGNGRKVLPIVFGELQPEINFVLDKFTIDRLATHDGPLDSPVILVDASDTNGLPGQLDLNRVVEIIDHRRSHQAELFPNAKNQIEFVGAAATLVAEKFISSKTDISKTSAVLLYSAIISNTLNFQAAVTTDRDKMAAAWLNKFLELDDDYAWEMFGSKSDLEGSKLRAAMDKTYGHYMNADRKILIVQLEMVGAKALVAKRKDDILRIMKEMTKEHTLDGYFMTISELKDCFNLFITDDLLVQNALISVFGVSFDHDVAQDQA